MIIILNLKPPRDLTIEIEAPPRLATQNISTPLGRETNRAPCKRLDRVG